MDDGFDLDNEDSFVDPDSPSRRRQQQVTDEEEEQEEGAAGDTLSPSSSPGPQHRFSSPTGGVGGRQKEKVLTLLDPAYRPVWNPAGKGEQ